MLKVVHVLRWVSAICACEARSFSRPLPVPPSNIYWLCEMGDKMDQVGRAVQSFNVICDSRKIPLYLLYTSLETLMWKCWLTLKTAALKSSCFVIWATFNSVIPPTNIQQPHIFRILVYFLQGTNKSNFPHAAASQNNRTTARTLAVVTKVTPKRGWYWLQHCQAGLTHTLNAPPSLMYSIHNPWPLRVIISCEVFLLLCPPGVHPNKDI